MNYAKHFYIGIKLKEECKSLDIIHATNKFKSKLDIVCECYCCNFVGKAEKVQFEHHGRIYYFELSVGIEVQQQGE